MSKIEMINVTRTLEVAEGEEPSVEFATINKGDVTEWEKKGWFPVDSEEPKTEEPKENPMKVLLEGWTLKRLKRVAVDLNLPEANSLPKGELIDALLETEWTPPEDE